MLSAANSATSDSMMEFTDHLIELRVRLLRAIVYIVVGMSTTYLLNTLIFEVLSYPLYPVMAGLQTRGIHSYFAYTGVMQPFLLQMQIAFISGLIVAQPLIVLELWGFVAPALTREEKKPLGFLAPFSLLLFLAGVGLGYACLFPSFQWMASFINKGTVLQQNPQDYLLLVVKTLLAFGIAFELPVVLLFLARIGIIDSAVMTRYWRQAVVIIASLTAILTPSNDPLTMMLMAIPMSGLYLLSIYLVKAFEKKSNGERSPSLFTLIGVALAPAGILIAVAVWLYRIHIH